MARKKTETPEQKGETFEYPRALPQDFVLITDKNHTLYDPRVEMALDEQMIRNVMDYGVRLPVIVRTNTTGYEGQKVVTDGRQRVRWTSEANKRLEAAGQPLRDIKYVVADPSETDEEAFVLHVVLNEVRKDNDPLAQAHLIQRLIDPAGKFKKSEEEVAIIFGCSVQTIRGRMKLLELSPEAQKAISAGTVPATEAARVAGKGEDAEKALLAKRTAKPKGHRAPKSNKKAIAKAARELADKGRDLNAKVKAVLYWVAGEIETQALMETLELIKPEKKKGEKTKGGSKKKAGASA